MRSDVGTAGGSMDGLRGVRIPDGVDVPLRLRLRCQLEKGNKKLIWDSFRSPADYFAEFTTDFCRRLFGA